MLSSRKDSIRPFKSIWNAQSSVEKEEYRLKTYKRRWLIEENDSNAQVCRCLLIYICIILLCKCLLGCSTQGSDPLPTHFLNNIVILSANYEDGNNLLKMLNSSLKSPNLGHRWPCMLLPRSHPEAGLNKACCFFSSSHPQLSSCFLLCSLSSNILFKAKKNSEEKIISETIQFSELPFEFIWKYKKQKGFIFTK